MSQIRLRAVTALLLLAVLTAQTGCISPATRLASLKANYNEGKWGYVLGTARAKRAYSADDVIKAAGSDTLTADQARLIKARALMQAFIEDKLAAGVSPLGDPSLAQALSLMKDLAGKDFKLKWMNVELMAAIADYFYILDDYAAAFDAYDYLLKNADFTSLEAPYRQYVRRWVEMKRHFQDLVTSRQYIDFSSKAFKTTYVLIVKKLPDDIGTIKAGIMILDDEGQPRAAVQRAMLARFTAARNPKTQKQYLSEIDELVASIITTLRRTDTGEANRLEKEYKWFTKSYDEATLTPHN